MENNRRKHDGKAGIAATAATVISAIWGGVVWLDGILVTQSELDRQRYYTDYQVARLKMEINRRLIENIESQIDNGEPISAAEMRNYNRLLAARPALEKEVERLAAIF